ncbi:MAG: polysaccharide deacetylase family protein [Clostridiaceae bacterium]|nr:polysaccharide deacetylase family protein [Clostridiaceae bacterium]
MPCKIRKAVTFSYDDGVTQDQRLIELLNQYNLKCTFNLNSSLLGTGGPMLREEVTIPHVKPRSCEIASIYEGHEIASHTLTHPFLPDCDEEEIVRQVERDREALSTFCGYEVVGFAYPGGGVNFDERVADVLRRKTGVRYARTTVSSFHFEPQSDLFVFKPTVYHHREWDALFELGHRFVELNADRPQIFYIWGHAYEFDIHNTWSRFEEFCKLIANRDDIYYGTNRQVLMEDWAY